MAEDSWPPRSPLKALLSSPSGRRRFQEYKDSTVQSPKRLLGTPSLVDKLRAARADRDDLILENRQARDEREDEDEETLKLQLAAIEAKLKLKKLQQKKEKQDDIASEPPSSVHVALSPLKRIENRSVHKSPSRVVLGIDKGLTGADISLKRARTTASSPIKSRLNRPQSAISSRLHLNGQNSSKSSPVPVKSFSERMSVMRDVETTNQQKQDARNSARVSAFKIDRKELNSYVSSIATSSSRHQADRDILASHRAELASTREPFEYSPGAARVKELLSQPPSPTAHKPEDIPKVPARHTGDPTLYEDFSKTHLSTRILPHSFLKRTLPPDEYKVFRLPDLLKVVHSPDYEIPEKVLKTPNFVVFGIVASKSNPLNHKGTLSEQTVDGPAKSKNKTDSQWDDGSNNSKKFLALTLTDLTWTLDLYLFGTALPRFHRLTPGTLIAILNPYIMPPKPGREDSGAFSLALHSGASDDGTQVLEIGTAKNLGFCTATKRDGHTCDHWVNKAKTEICEYHVNAQLARVQSSRSGVNASTAGAFGKGKGEEEDDYTGKGRGRGRGRGMGEGQFRNPRLVHDSRAKATKFDHDFGRGRGNGVPVKRGRNFDFESQSQYYIASGRGSSAGQRGAGTSAARTFVAEQEDPFLAEGLRSSERDKQALFRKRAEAMQKEREIMKKLGGIGGSAGGEYMRSQTGQSQSGVNPEDDKRKAALKEMKENILDSGNANDAVPDVGGTKRKAAESVRLSPVKKTRFLTERGIKEAGRDSLGGTRLSLENLAAVQNRDDDDDDDDLDIV